MVFSKVLRFLCLFIFLAAEGSPVGGREAAGELSRTVIFVYYESIPDEYVFLRGGISMDHRENCTEDATTDNCAIPIQTRMIGTIDTYDSYNYWRVGDNFFDWHGAEATQGLFNGAPASGSPTAWTTNNPFSPAYQELNKYGDNYWMIDMNMDCSKTEQGWFEMKTFINNWEGDLPVAQECTGPGGEIPSYVSANHMALCGFVNVFSNGDASCTIEAF